MKIEQGELGWSVSSIHCTYEMGFEEKEAEPATR